MAKLGCGCFSIIVILLLGMILFNAQPNYIASSSAPAMPRPALAPRSSLAELPDARRLSDEEPGVITVAPGWWPCGSTEEAFSNITKWLVLKDMREALRTMLETRSLALTGGMQVKVLEHGFVKSQVRVLHSSVRDDPRIYRKCWVAVEAVR